MNLKKIQEQQQTGYFSKLRKPRKSKIKENDHYTCLLCGNDAQPDCAYHELYMCSRCLDYALNVNSYVRAGKFETWDNSILCNPSKKTCKKKKISHELKKQVFERDAYRCKHCGAHIDLCADHIKPESWGGETTLENLQTLCRSCNSKKKNRYEG